MRALALESPRNRTYLNHSANFFLFSPDLEGVINILNSTDLFCAGYYNPIEGERPAASLANVLEACEKPSNAR